VQRLFGEKTVKIQRGNNLAPHEYVQDLLVKALLADKASE